MRRLPTTMFLAGWAGFLGTAAVVSCAAILTIANPEMVPLPFVGEQAAASARVISAGGNVGVLAAAFAALISLVVASFLALSIWLLQGRTDEDRTVGESMTFAGFAAAGLLVVFAHVGGVGIFPQIESLTTFGTIVGLSFLSVVFDRMIETEEGDADDADFEAATLLIAHGMAREALRNPVVIDAAERRARR